MEQIINIHGGFFLTSQTHNHMFKPMDEACQVHYDYNYRWLVVFGYSAAKKKVVLGET